MMKKIIHSVIALFCLSLTVSVFAQPKVPDHRGRWVIDDANILDENTEQTITSLVKTHYDSTSNQVVVYTFPSLEGSTIEAYANEVFNKWHPGSKENNNGVLLIIAFNDHKMRIEVGYGLEPTLTDLETQDIIQNLMVPKFKEGKYNEGVLEGVQAILDGIKGSYSSGVKPAEFSFKNNWWVLIIALVFTFIAAGSKGCMSYIIIGIVVIFTFFFGSAMGGLMLGIGGAVVSSVLFIILKVMMKGGGKSGGDP